MTSPAFVSGEPVYVKLRSKIQNRWVTQRYVFQTQAIPTQCGDGICQPDEGYALCAVDCPSPLCGNGICSAEDGENGINCQPDEGHVLCGVDCPSPLCGNGVCSAMDGKMGPIVSRTAWKRRSGYEKKLIVSHCCKRFFCLF